MADKQSESPAHGELIRALRIVALQSVAKDRFRFLTPPPEWFRDLVPEPGAELRASEMFPFLENFLLEAGTFWNSAVGDRLDSGPWVETSGEGKEYHLEASAITVEGLPVLLVQELGQGYDERRDLLQKARENSLNHQRLVKEIQLKEVLLHCIVHDLAGPLTGVKGLFSLLGNEDLSEAGQRRLELGLEASRKLESQIREILHVFSAEVDSLRAFSMDPEAAPDLISCVGTVVETLSSAAQLKGISFETRSDVSGELKVVGETTRLERVLYNLLENALRYTPTGETIRIKMIPAAEVVRVEVCDRGPGVPAAVANSLFQKFMQQGNRSGKVGLGLYFCRIIVERWGGSIGFKPRDGGGTCFWFELPQVSKM